MKKQTVRPLVQEVEQQPMSFTIFDVAKEKVYGDRQDAYGHPKENFNDITILWDAWCKVRDIPAHSPSSWEDVVALNILQKLARLAKNPTHMDSWVDIAGYAATAERCITEK